MTPPTLRSLLASILVSGVLPPTVGAAEPTVPAEWLTRAEASDFRATSSYDETLAFLRRLEARLPQMRLSFYGTSAEGRPLPVVVLSREKAFTAAEARRLAKPIVLIVNGIHAGEIDGKDSCLMILRDLALGRRQELLDAVTVLIVPIYNVDGHERVSRFNRPNQDGPAEGMGFRTTASGLDLNRDHMKLATAEARALVGLFNEWRPHLHVDDHVSNGFDHAWVVGYAASGGPGGAGAGGRMAEGSFPGGGGGDRAGRPRHRALPRAPRRERPRGRLRVAGRPRRASRRATSRCATVRLDPGGDALVQAVPRPRAGQPGLPDRAASRRSGRTRARSGRRWRRRRRPPWPGAGSGRPSPTWPSPSSSTGRTRSACPLYAWRSEPSVVTGQPFPRQRRGTAETAEFPWQHGPKPARAVPRPRGYLVLPGWPQIEQSLRAHGLRALALEEPAEIEVETSRLSSPRFAPQTYQGLTQVTSVDVARRLERRRVPGGDAVDPRRPAGLRGGGAPPGARGAGLAAGLGPALERVREEGVHRPSGPGGPRRRTC